jgi:hypothetical protein
MIMRINKFFKKRLDVPQAPPVGSWEYIQANIEQKPTKRKPMIPFWWKTSGIAATLLLLMGTAYLMDWNIFSKSSNSQMNSPKGNLPSLVQNEGNSQNSSNLQDINSTSMESQLNNNSSETNYNSYTQSKYPSSFWISSQSSFANNHYSHSNYNQNSHSNYGENSTIHSLNNSINDNPNSSLSKEELIAQLQKEFSQNLPSWNPEYTNAEKVLEKILNEEPIPADNNTGLMAANIKPDEKKKVYHTKKKVEFDRFFISAFISPMALNTFVGNSMLSDDMSQYKTENNILLAYGVKGGYAVSPKVRIRTGVSVIGFEQITKDVPFSYAIEGVSGFNFSRDQSNNIKYHGNLRVDNEETSIVNNEIINRVGTGSLQQQSQYIEIPVEAEVKLFKTSSIGISATGGGSTWLLSKNKIFAHTDDFTEELGKAENLNKTSFSANAGLKFDMNLTENIQLNVEPTFKYLINPVNDIKNYNPYTVGVNAGVTLTIK